MGPRLPNRQNFHTCLSLELGCVTPDVGVSMSLLRRRAFPAPSCSQLGRTAIFHIQVMAARWNVNGCQNGRPQWRSRQAARSPLRPQNDFDTLRSWFLLGLFWRQDFDPYPTPFMIALRRRPIPLQAFGHHYSKQLNAKHVSFAL